MHKKITIYLLFMVLLLNTVGVVNATTLYDGTKILVYNGTENLSSISKSLNNNSILEQETKNIWILKKPIIVKNTGVLNINSADCNWLKLESSNDSSITYVENLGTLNISNANITSWNTQTKDFAPKTDIKRAYIYSHGVQLLLNSCDLSYLGGSGAYGLWGVSLYGDKKGARITNVKLYNNFKGLSIDEDNVYIYNIEVYNSSDKGITIAHLVPVNNLWMEKVESHLSPNGCPIHLKYWSTGGVHNATLIDVDAHHGNGNQIHFSSARDSKLIRVKAHDSGWYDENKPWQDGAGVSTDQKPTMTEYTHTGLDLHTDVHNVYVEEFEGWNVENALYIHNSDENITVKNSSVHDSFGGFNVQGGNKNITFDNCTSYNIGFGNHYQGAGFNIQSSSDITIRNSEVTGSLFGARIISYEWENPKQGNNTENITFENNTFYDQVGPSYFNFLLYQEGLYFKNIQINNQQEQKFELRRNFLYEPPYPLKVVIKYDTGKLFKVDNEWASIYPNGSFITYTLGKHALVNTYDIFIKPTSGKVDIILNNFNISLPMGNTLVNFTVDPNETTNVTYDIAKLQPNHSYIVKRDCDNFTQVQAKSSGHIQFSNLESSKHTYTIEETLSLLKQTNSLPVITSFEPTNGSAFNEGQKIKISLNASDVDKQALSYTIKIDGAICSNSSSYIWSTNYSSSGNHIIELNVSDGINAVKKISNIYVNNYHPRWDVNKDERVDFEDINIIAQNYGTAPKVPYPDWDVNQDGAVNLDDLLLAEFHFGEKVG